MIARPFDHRNNPHRSIVMPAERARAIKRAADMLGVSGEAFIQRCLDIGLDLFLGDDNDPR